MAANAISSMMVVGSTPKATELAERLGGYYIDQFTYAERATDWRGNNNIAESIFEQMRGEHYPIPIGW
jgi:cysteine synthase A